MNQSFQQARCGCEVEPEVTRVVEDRSLERELGNASRWLVRQLWVSYGSMVEQHASTQHLEAVAPARAIGDLDQAVHGFGVGVGHPLSKLPESRYFAPPFLRVPIVSSPTRG